MVDINLVLSIISASAGLVGLGYAIFAFVRTNALLRDTQAALREVEEQVDEITLQVKGLSGSLAQLQEEVKSALGNLERAVTQVMEEVTSALAVTKQSIGNLQSSMRSMDRSVRDIGKRVDETSKKLSELERLLVDSVEEALAAGFMEHGRQLRRDLTQDLRRLRDIMHTVDERLTTLHQETQEQDSAVRESIGELGRRSERILSSLLVARLLGAIGHIWTRFALWLQVSSERGIILPAVVALVVVGFLLYGVYRLAAIP